MNALVKQGQYRTILISVIILAISIQMDVFHHLAKGIIDEKELIKQIVRFLFTFVLLLLTYEGKRWAVIISIVLFSFATLIAFIGLIRGGQQSLLVNTLFLEAILIYSIAIYYFGFSETYRTFRGYQNRSK